MINNSKDDSPLHSNLQISITHLPPPAIYSLLTPSQSRIKSESFALELRSPSMVSFESSSDSYEVWSPLGSVCGGRGTVWLARHKPTNMQVALKIYELDKCEDEFELIQVRREGVEQVWEEVNAMCVYLFTFID